jgi:HAD superfamily hydrolase (TIGR01509 family)
MSAVLFGSISTLADTSELQRRAFNEAFAASGLDWEWSRDDYISMLDSNGGAQRIEEYANSRGEQVDAAAVHAKKTEIFQRLLGESSIAPREGVAEVVADAKQHHHKVGFVTTTSPGNIEAVLAALEPHLGADSFDLIVDVDSVSTAKPAAAAYQFALQQLDEEAGDVVAIEDNVGGVAAAVAAGIRCVAFPNENTKGGDFSAATEVVDSLDPGSVLDLVKS